MEQYKIICQKCGGSDVIKITPDHTVFYTEHVPIISSRYRPDMNWGFECTCGQDSRIAPEERGQLDRLVPNATTDMIKEIAKSLTLHNELKFVMERI